MLDLSQVRYCVWNNTIKQNQAQFKLTSPYSVKIWWEVICFVAGQFRGSCDDWWRHGFQGFHSWLSKHMMTNQHGIKKKSSKLNKTSSSVSVQLMKEDMKRPASLYTCLQPCQILKEFSTGEISPDINLRGDLDLHGCANNFGADCSLTFARNFNEFLSYIHLLVYP